MKKYYIVWVPELGWDSICALYLASSENNVWKALCQNEGDTVEKLKKNNFYQVREFTLEEIK